MRGSIRIFAGAVAVVVGALMSAASPAEAGISASISPDTTFVASEQIFTVYVWVDSAGSDFDGYETIIRWDPAYIEFQSIQEESLMTEACEENTWWYTLEGPDSVFVSHVELCGGLTITGPGALSSLTFKALQDGTTHITFDYLDFFRAGDPVPDVGFTDGVVEIGVSDAGTGAAAAAGEAWLRLDPNPSSGAVSMTFNLLRGGPVEIGLYDASGRRVANPVGPLVLEAGLHRYRWNPRTELPGGVYFMTARGGGWEVRTKTVRAR
jgi:hypothetical protein